MIISSDVQAGVYPDDEFRADFAAAMRKASGSVPSMSTPPVENSKAPRVAPAAADGQGVCLVGRVKPWDRAHAMAVQVAREVLEYRAIAKRAEAANDLAKYRTYTRLARTYEGTVRMYAADALWSAQT